MPLNRLIMLICLAPAARTPISRSGLKTLPNAPGVYFVLGRMGVVYVGKSINIMKRWNGAEPHHVIERLLRSERRLVFIKMPEFLIHGFEAEAIRSLKPKHNKRSEPFSITGFVWFYLFLVVRLSLVLGVSCLVVLLILNIIGGGVK